MNIPAYAQSFVSGFQSNGTLPGLTERTDLSKSEANEALQGLKDQFSHWQSLDETDADLLKGQPGEVRIQGYRPEESTTASFSGNTQDGQLTVVQDEPTMHYGSTSVSVTNFKPMTADSLSVIAGPGYVMGPWLTHIDHQIQSSGPISLGGSSTTVTLTDQANGGYIVTAPYLERC